MARRSWATKIITFCVTFPITLVVVLFAVSNRDPVEMSLWPVPAVLEAPLYLPFLIAVAAGFVLGELIAWSGELGHKMRAAKAEKRIAELEKELAVMRIREEEIRAKAGATQITGPGRPQSLVDRRAS
jgi:uncharacterized integral membrane protein